MQERPGKAKLRGVCDMKKGTLFLLGMPAVLLALGIALGGCATTASGPQKAAWNDQTVHTSKEYTVVGAVVVRTTDSKTINADLMEKVLELGGHDILNVRVDVETGVGGKKILAATAVAIKYTDETLKSGTTAVTADGLTTTSGDIGKDLLAKSDSSTQSSEEAPKRKKFLGIF